MNRDGVRATDGYTADVVWFCDKCSDYVTDSGASGRNRLALLARRHTAKTGHETSLSTTRVVRYLPESPR